VRSLGSKWEINQTLDGIETFRVDKGLRTILDRFMVHRILKFSRKNKRKNFKLVYEKFYFILEC